MFIFLIDNAIVYASNCETRTSDLYMKPKRKPRLNPRLGNLILYHVVAALCRVSDRVRLASAEMTRMRWLDLIEQVHRRFRITSVSSVGLPVEHSESNLSSSTKGTFLSILRTDIFLEFLLQNFVLFYACGPHMEILFRVKNATKTPSFLPKRNKFLVNIYCMAFF